MASPRMASQSVSGLCALAILLLGLTSATAPAQDPTAYYNPASWTDIYGNARPRYRERRLAGLFQNQAQRQALRGYQSTGRRANRRGGLTPFALPSDRLWQAPTRRYAPMPSVATMSPATVSPSMRRAFERHGGFGQRLQERDAADIGSVLGRRSALIQATSLNAPVHRSMWQLGTAGTLTASFRSTTLTEPEVPEAPEGGPTLDQALHQVVVQSYRQSRAEGWAMFTEGEYRRAARAFETVTLLQPADFESRIGELFCHVSLGGMRTSATLLTQLTRRDRNPFLHDLRISERYGTTEEARQVQLRAQLFAQANSGIASAEALHVFVLWYLGAREEAILTATGLSRDFPGTIYADWPARMRAAETALNAEGEQPIGMNGQ